jgi:hypothetical protein
MHDREYLYFFVVIFIGSKNPSKIDLIYLTLFNKHTLI